LGPGSNDRYSSKRKAEGGLRQTQGGRPRTDGARDGDDTATGHGAPRRAGRHYTAGQGLATDSPSRLPGSNNRLTPWLQTSGLRKCERIHFCCSKPPSLWFFVTGSLRLNQKELCGLTGNPSSIHNYANTKNKPPDRCLSTHFAALLSIFV